MFHRWRRLDYPSLEILHWHEHAAGISARSVIVDAGDEPFGLIAEWRLDRFWLSRSLKLELTDAQGVRRLEIERAGPEQWLVNGEPRADLDGCLEIDVSATPFCNGLALRRLGNQPGELVALHVNAAALSVEPSRQRYERAGENWRYVDLGAAKGFTAVLEFDERGIVRNYEGLFEAL